MKIIPKLLISFLLGILLISSTAAGSLVHATGRVQQTGMTVLYPLTSPPAKMCRGDTVPIAFWIQSSYLSVPFSIEKASNGNLSLPTTRFNGGYQYIVVNGKFKATQAGAGFITIGVSTGLSTINWQFDVIECEYSINFYATSTTVTDLATFRVDTEGNGQFSGSDQVEGFGNYSVMVKADLVEIQDNPCVLTGEGIADGGFSISGTNTEGAILIDISFTASQLSSPEFECQDANDKQAAVALFPGGTINPNQDLNLTGLAFSPGQTSRRLPFGSNGYCQIMITRRAQK